MFSFVKVKSLIKKQDPLTTLNGSCYSLSDSSIVFDVGRSFLKDKDFYSQIANRDVAFEANWQRFSELVNLFISHIHEDHYAGIFNIPENLKINLYIGQLSFNILQYKAKELQRELPMFNEVFLLKENVPFHVEEWIVTPVKIPHNIVDNWGFVVKREGIKEQFIYSPDISEKFWNYFLLYPGDSLLIDMLPELPDTLKRNDLESLSFEKKQEMNKIVFVDYGWDFCRIESFLREYFGGDTVFFSPQLYNNARVINYLSDKFNYKLSTYDEVRAFCNYVFFCDMSEFLDLCENYPKSGVSVVSNLYELSISHQSVLSQTNFEFYNFFKSGHFSSVEIKDYLARNFKKSEINLVQD